MKERNTKVHVIRIPIEISNEIKSQADITDRSFNRVVLRILEAHVKQEAQTKKG